MSFVSKTVLFLSCLFLPLASVQAAQKVNGLIFPSWFDTSKLDSNYKCNNAVINVDLAAKTFYSKNKEAFTEWFLSSPFKVNFADREVQFYPFNNNVQMVYLEYLKKTDEFSLCYSGEFAGQLTAPWCYACKPTDESYMPAE